MEKEYIAQAVAYLAYEWRLSDIRPLAELRLVNNYLAVAYSAVYKADVVLKILLWEDAQKYEAAALRYFNGAGCIKLLAYDERYHALLLPYIKPGETLRSLFPAEDERAVQILAKTSKKFHTHPITDAAASHFPTVAQWLMALNKEYTNIPTHLLEDARSRAQHLLQQTSTMSLLHGDLHHENILHAGDAWIAIDPKGVVGEQEYEYGAFIRNPYPDLIVHSDVQNIINRRIELCGNLSGFNTQRIADWAFVQAVLSACWTHECGKEKLMTYFIACASVIQRC